MGRSIHTAREESTTKIQTATAIEATSPQANPEDVERERVRHRRSIGREAVYILTAQLAESALGLATNNLTPDLHRARQPLRAELTQSCKVCSKHGCLDCTCDPADGGSAHRPAGAAQE